MVLNCCKLTTKSCNLPKLGQDYREFRDLHHLGNSKKIIIQNP